MGTLYVVPTPIGNLEDMTLRGLSVLRAVRLIAAEDTRHSRKLLTHFDIKTPLTSYHEHNKLTKAGAILDALSVGDVALISDAGTPGISDPGYELIGLALEAGYPVVPLPGPSAILAALAASGLPAVPYRFYGFPPRKDKALREFFESLATLPETLALFESPNRLVKTLDVLAGLDAFRSRQVVVGVELTKYYEEFARGTPPELAAHFRAHPLRGEVTLLLAGNTLSVGT
jgi:16S rRNA (cytidine1402-2'-O)-methyltransferase